MPNLKLLLCTHCQALSRRLYTGIATKKYQRINESLTKRYKQSAAREKGDTIMKETTITITDAVRAGYGTVARSGLSSEQGNIRGIAQAFGYSEEELASIPAEANMGLSCGNPVAMASIKAGEVVVDLGAGGGLDVFLASKAVGPEGRAIGIDMTGDMVSLARKNAAKGGYTNVTFYLAEIEAMPLADNSVDCVISNCVLNLCADKEVALKEIFRVLKPGGRLAISDIALRKPLPPEIERAVAAWTGCIAGAMTIDQNRSKLAAAGFSAVEIVDSNSDLNAYRDGGHAACCGPASDADMSGKAADGDSDGCCGPIKERTGCCGEAPESTENAADSDCDGAKENKSDSGCCGETAKADENAAEVASEFHETMSDLLKTFDVNEYAASVKIFALKPE